MGGQTRTTKRRSSSGHGRSVGGHDAFGRRDFGKEFVAKLSGQKLAKH